MTLSNTTDSIAIQSHDLGYRYRYDWAVRHLNLQVPLGHIYGFLGLNGAGKSTTIRMLMSLLQRREGEVQILGLDPLKDPVGVKSKVGYVGDTHHFYEWMRIRELLAFVARYRPTWDAELSNQLLERFNLAGHIEHKVSELSKGQRSKISLLLALAFRPKLLILDEPTSGLDPAARRDFFEDLLAGYQEEGGTIFISSHLVDEISGIVDHVGLIHEGAMLLEMPAETLRDSVKRVRLIFDAEVPATEITCPGRLRVRKNGREATVSVRDFSSNPEQVLRCLKAYNPARLDVEDLSLEDIFVELVGKREVES